MLCKNPCSAVFAALLALILVSGALMQGTGGSGSSSGGAKYPSGSLLNGDYSTVLDNDLPPGPTRTSSTTRTMTRTKPPCTPR